jgi:hypothetical protein
MATIYEVQAPDGSILEIEGPDGADEAQIMQAAAELYQPQQQAAPQQPGQVPQFGSMETAAEIPGLDQNITAQGGYVEPPTPQPVAAVPVIETEAYTMTPAGPVRKAAGDTLAGVAETGGAIATGSTTGMGGQVRGTLLQLAEEIQSGKFGTADAAQRIKQAAEQLGAEYTYQPRGERGQQMTQAAGEFAGRYLAPLTGMVGQPLPNVGPIIPATAAVAPAVRRGAEGVGQMARRASDVAAETGLGQVVGDVAAAVKARGVVKDAGAVRLVRDQPYNMANAEILIQGPKGAERIVPDTLAAAATRQGWKPSVVAAIKAGSDLDRLKGIQMINRYKAGQVDELKRATMRPTDIIGNTIESRIKFLVNIKDSSGKEIRRIADTDLKQQPVAYEPAINDFEQSLADLGVGIVERNGKLVVDLKGSDIEGDAPAAEILNTVLRRMYETNAPKNAYDIHRLKRYLDTQVNYGPKRQNALTAEAERTIKNLRRGLNRVLGEKFPAYKAANERYSDSIGALDDLQRGVGSSIDLDGDNVASALGTASRKLTSNYATRVNLMDALELLDQVAKKHGMKINDSVINQVIMANEIDRMFGATADTSLKGIMQQVERGVDIARSDALTAALTIVKEGANRFRGVNEKNAIKAMEELLRRKMEPQEPNTLPVAPE